MGVPASGDDGKYGPDASRTPWRVAVDYAWSNEPKASTFLNAAAGYVDANGGIAPVRAEQRLSRRPGDERLACGEREGASVHGCLAPDVSRRRHVFSGLRPIYLLLLADAFTKSCL